MNSDQLAAALMEFVLSIEATGGVTWVNNNGRLELVPKADAAWLDLASAYMRACKVLDRTPAIDDQSREYRD